MQRVTIWVPVHKTLRDRHLAALCQTCRSKRIASNLHRATCRKLVLLDKEIQVPVPRVNGIVRERRAITADTAMRLARFFGNSEKFWMNLQSSYDLRAAKAKLTKQLAAIRPRAAVTEASF